MNLVTEQLATATLEEKVGMMSGRGFFAAFAEDGGVWGARPYRAGGGIERLGIEPLYFTDGPRGVARGQSTCFPCSMARGASFDVDLERRIGEAMGKEARAQGCTLSGAVCINLLRHPAWGRAQETYGEDPHHLGRMGAALGLGIQAHGVIATVKHYALNSMENARFTIDVTVDQRTLHEIYLPHFKHCLDAGIGSVMSAYNRVNGEYCGQDRPLLTDILRGEWGFTGFVHSDWVMGVYQPYGAAAGLDIENPEPIVFGERLVQAVESGAIEPRVIDQACSRILATQAAICARDLPLESYGEDLVACTEHRALALEAAEKSAVLLENNGALPFDRHSVRKLAVLGRLATLENTGDHGSSRVRAPEIVTALGGLRAYLGEDAVLTGDEDNLEAATEAARSADAVVVVVGYTAEEEGEYIPSDLTLGQAGSNQHVPEVLKEARKTAPPRLKAIGGDRLDLALPAAQVRLIEAAAASGKPVIVVVVAGSAVLVEEWRAKSSAILQTFYSGMAGGTALARLLFGDVSPSGRLPFTVAKRVEDYPFFDRDAAAITYDYWHGYAKLLRDGVQPRYAYGHGLSYSSVARRALHVRRIGDVLRAELTLRNDGDRVVDDVVHLFVRYPGAVQPRWPRALKAFARASALRPGESRILSFEIALSELLWRDPETSSWHFEPGVYRIEVGANAADITLNADIVL
jgi:beta-glucosidase